MSASFYIIYATETKDTIQNEENGPLNFESKHRISFILPAEIGHRFKNIYITCANFEPIVSYQHNFPKDEPNSV